MRGGVVGKAATCVFHLEGCEEGDTHPPSHSGLSHLDSPQIATASRAGFAARISKRTSLAPVGSGPHLEPRRRGKAAKREPISGGTRSVTLK